MKVIIFITFISINSLQANFQVTGKSLTFNSQASCTERLDSEEHEQLIESARRSALKNAGSKCNHRYPILIEEIASEQICSTYKVYGHIKKSTTFLSITSNFECNFTH